MFDFGQEKVGTVRDIGVSADPQMLGTNSRRRIHNAYRYRILLGPSYRADVWSVLENEPSHAVSDWARRTYGSFATA